MVYVYNELYRLAALNTESFRDGVRDSFGASIIADALEPILNEINSLQCFNEEFQRQAINVDSIIEKVRTIKFKD